MSSTPSPALPSDGDEGAFLAVAEVLPSLVALIRAGRLLYANPAFCALLGRGREEFVGREPWAYAAAEDVQPMRERLESVQAGGELPQGFTQRLTHADGRELWIECSLVRLSLAGRPTILVSGLDVTLRKQAERALRKSEERFRSVFLNASIGKGVATPDLRFLEVNRAYCEMFGYSEQELLQLTPLDITHPDDAGGNLRLLDELLAGPATSGRVLKLYRHKQGHCVWGDLTLTLIRDEQGRPAYFLAEVVDVTESRRADELLRDREAKLAEAQRVAHLGSWEYDIATKRSLWSEEMFRIFQLDPRSFDPSRHSAIPRIHPDDVEHSGAHVQQTIEKGTPYEYEFRIVLDDGEVRMLWTIGRAEYGADGKPSRIYGIVQDITERKRADLALRSSEQRIRSIYNDAPVLLTVSGPDGLFREVSNFWLTSMGYSREEVIGRQGHEFIEPASHERMLQEFERTLRTGESVMHSIPLVGIRKDGTRMHALTTSLLETDESGALTGVVTVGLDVSHIHRTEDALRESEARYRALVEHAPEAIAVLDVASGKFVDLNENAERLFGHDRERILGMGPMDFCPAIQPDGRSSQAVAAHYIQRAQEGESPTFEFVCTHASGREFPSQIRLSKLPSNDRDLIRSSVSDISEWKLLQENVRHSDRMAAIGVLAAGVAHEVGNPLLALSMAVQSLQRKTGDDYSKRKLELLATNIDRITRIVRQMSDLARPRASNPVSCDLNRVIERALEIVRYDPRAKEVEIRFEPRPDLPLVLCVADQISQVCLNLSLNALDAMASNPPERPRTLVVRTGTIEGEAGRLARATFADSGPGIPADSRARVFQPFFTTKAPGLGTGLGLSVSARIAEEHRGRLAFECPAQGGTCFHFDLPVTEDS